MTSHELIRSACRDLREAYRAEFEQDCRDGAVGRLRDRLWNRLYHFDGPPIDFLHNEEPVVCLQWVAAALAPDHQRVLGRAAIELFQDKLLVDAPAHAS